MILDPRHLNLLTDFWARQHACLIRSRDSSARRFVERTAAAAAAMPQNLPANYSDPPLEQPPYVTADRLEPHQLEGAAMLRRMYVAGQDCILADDPALGMVATMVTFLQVLLIIVVGRRRIDFLFLLRAARHVAWPNEYHILHPNIAFEAPRSVASNLFTMLFCIPP